MSSRYMRSMSLWFDWQLRHQYLSIFSSPQFSHYSTESWEYDYKSSVDFESMCKAPFILWSNMVHNPREVLLFPFDKTIVIIHFLYSYISSFSKWDGIHQYQAINDRCSLVVELLRVHAIDRFAFTSSLCVHVIAC